MLLQDFSESCTVFYNDTRTSAKEADANAAGGSNACVKGKGGDDSTAVD